MKKSMFSVYDEKAKIFFPPLFSVERGEMIRTFSDIVKDPQSMLHKHPEDYKLYYLGTFCEKTGKFDPVLVPEFVNNASDFIVKA